MTDPVAFNRVRCAAATPRCRPRRGAAAVEFAFTLPVLLAAMLGIWEVGRMVELYQVVNNAAREGGRQAAAGQKTATQVEQDVLNYLARAGLATTGTTVTITNQTAAARSDPSTANQMDQFRITVDYPYSNARWSLTSQFTSSTTTVSATTDWYSMRNLPVSVSTNIPVE